MEGLPTTLSSSYLTVSFDGTSIISFLVEYIPFILPVLRRSSMMMRAFLLCTLPSKRTTVKVSSLPLVLPFCSRLSSITWREEQKTLFG